MAEKVGVEVRNPFVVLDGTSTPVTGLVTASFTITVTRDNVVLATPVPTVEESLLADGRYHLKITPDLPGFYDIKIVHATHFPDGMFVSFQALTSTEADFEEFFGFLGKNSFIDNVVTTRGQITAYRKRLFASKALADTAVEGESGNDGFASYQYTKVLDPLDADNPETIKITKET